MNFLDDIEKMIDFKILTKKEFLKFYSYLTEEEYDNTLKFFKRNEAILKWKKLKQYQQMKL